MDKSAENIIYLSALIEPDQFEAFRKNGFIQGGFQAQKFNYLVATGLSEFKKVYAVSNPPFSTVTPALKPMTEDRDNITYMCLGNHSGKFHKVWNFLEGYKQVKQICESNKIYAIVCDAINPLAGFIALLSGKKYKIPAIAVVTDIPELMDAGKESFFTRFTTWCMHRFEGYVLLTEAMNGYINKKNKPYIIMEGLCEDNKHENSEPKANKNEFECLYTGSLSCGTGLEALIDAFKETDIPNLSLHILGAGKLQDYIEEESKKNSRIIYDGIASNEETVRRQRNAGLLINPRPSNVIFGECSFPSKIMEYMVSGTPVLTTRLPGIPKEYFDYVYTIDDESATGIQSKLETIYGEDIEARHKKGNAAREFVLGKKNKTVQAKRIVDFIGELK